MSSIFKTAAGTASGGGDVTSSGVVVDDAAARFDGITGLIIQGSPVIITDAVEMSGATQWNVDNIRIDGNTISTTSGALNLTPNGSGVNALTQLTLTTPLDEIYGGTGFASIADNEFIYASATNTLAKLAAPTIAGSILRFDGSVPYWSNITNTFWFSDDFITGQQTANIVGNRFWQGKLGGAGTITTNTTTAAGHPGTLDLNTALTLGSGANIRQFSDNSTQQPIIIGGGVIVIEMIVKIDTLSDATNAFNFKCGIANQNSVTSTVGGQGVYFTYASTGATPNWYRFTGNSGASITTTDSGTAATTNWVNLKIVINAAGTSAEFFIDDVSVGTNSTNLPTLAVGPMFNMATSQINLAARKVTVDYYSIFQKLTNSR